MMQHPLIPYIACVSTGLFSFYNLLQFSLFNALSPFLIALFHLNTVHLGMLSSGYLVANALWLVPGGLVLDRTSERKFGLVFMALAVVSCILMLNFVSPFAWAILRFVQGLASAASLLLCARLSSIWFPNSSSLAMGLIVALALLGGVVGNLIFPYLIIYKGCHYALLWDAQLGAILWIIVFLGLRAPILLPTYRSTNNFFDTKLFFQFITTPLIIFSGLYIGLMNLPIFLLGSLWGNLYLMHTKFLTISSAAELSAILFIGVIIGSPLWGWLSDQFNYTKSLLFLGALVSLVLAIVINQLSSFHLNTLKILFILLGASSSSQIICYKIIASYTPHHRSTATGIATLVENLIGALGQSMFGWLVSQWRLNYVSSHTSYELYSKAFELILWAFFLCIIMSGYLSIKTNHFSFENKHVFNSTR